MLLNYTSPHGRLAPLVTKCNHHPFCVGLLLADQQPLSQSAIIIHFCVPGSAACMKANTAACRPQCSVK